MLGGATIVCPTFHLEVGMSFLLINGKYTRFHAARTPAEAIIEATSVGGLVQTIAVAPVPVETHMSPVRPKCPKVMATYQILYVWPFKQVRVNVLQLGLGNGA